MASTLAHASRSLSAMPADAVSTYEFCQVMTTCTLRAEAVALGRSVVEARLAPCAQVEGPIGSTFWWDGEIQDTHEWRVVFKTRTDLFESLAQHIRANHAYEVPEIICLPILAGTPDYLDWMRAETGVS